MVLQILLAIRDMIAAQLPSPEQVAQRVSDLKEMKESLKETRSFRETVSSAVQHTPTPVEESIASHMGNKPVNFPAQELERGYDLAVRYMPGQHIPDNCILCHDKYERAHELVTNSHIQMLKDLDTATQVHCCESVSPLSRWLDKYLPSSFAKLFAWDSPILRFPSRLQRYCGSLLQDTLESRGRIKKYCLVGGICLVNIVLAVKICKWTYKQVKRSHLPVEELLTSQNESEQNQPFTENSHIDVQKERVADKLCRHFGTGMFFTGWEKSKITFLEDDALLHQVIRTKEMKRYDARVTSKKLRKTITACCNAVLASRFRAKGQLFLNFVHNFWMEQETPWFDAEVRIAKQYTRDRDAAIEQGQYPDPANYPPAYVDHLNILNGDGTPKDVLNWRFERGYPSNTTTCDLDQIDAYLLDRFARATQRRLTTWTVFDARLDARQSYPDEQLMGEERYGHLSRRAQGPTLLQRHTRTDWDERTVEQPGGTVHPDRTLSEGGMRIAIPKIREFTAYEKLLDFAHRWTRNQPLFPTIGKMLTQTRVDLAHQVACCMADHYVVRRITAEVLTKYTRAGLHGHLGSSTKACAEAAVTDRLTIHGVSLEAQQVLLPIIVTVVLTPSAAEAASDRITLQETRQALGMKEAGAEL